MLLMSFINGRDTTLISILVKQLLLQSSTVTDVGLAARRRWASLSKIYLIGIVIIS